MRSPRARFRIRSLLCIQRMHLCSPPSPHPLSNLCIMSTFLSRPQLTIVNIFTNADSVAALIWASALACVVAMVMLLIQRILTLNEYMEVCTYTQSQVIPVLEIYRAPKRKRFAFTSWSKSLLTVMVPIRTNCWHSNVISSTCGCWTVIIPAEFPDKKLPSLFQALNLILPFNLCITLILFEIRHGLQE